MQINGGGSGNVNVLQSDTGQYRNLDFVVAQRLAFHFGVIKPAVAGESGQIQIYNPVGSGVVFSCPDLSGVSFRRTVTEFATDQGVWVSQLSNGVDGHAKIRSNTEVAPAGFILGITYLAARTPFNFIPPGGIQIVEGLGYSVGSDITNTLFSAYFFGREV